jgi:hypothetical protein
MEQMLKFCLIICLIFSSSALVVAQIQSRKAHESFTPDWEEFSIENSIAFPVHFFYDMNPDRKNASRRYKNIVDGTYYFIFSDPVKNSPQADKVFEFIKYSQAARNNSPVWGRQDKKFKFTDTDGFYHTVFTVKTQKRVYVFQTTSEQEDDEQAESFFASIRIHAQTVPPDRAGYGVGRGMGEGNGNGGAACGGGNGDVIVPLKILSKPQPVYTDFARFYEIKGTVALQITFLANGELGEIQPISKLPFGLTRSAVEAAKSIKFSPPTRNGQPYSETRIEEYTFAIY